MLCQRSTNAWRFTRDAQLEPGSFFNPFLHDLLLTLLLHDPCLDDIHQAFNLLPCVTRMQTDSNSLATLWYSRRYNTTHYEAFSLTVRSELFRCGRKQREDRRLWSLGWDGEKWDVSVVDGLREGGDQSL